MRLLLAPFILAMTACPASKMIDPTATSDQAATQGQQDGVVKIRVGESVTLAAEGLQLALDRVTDDSRCPKGVTCVWAGDAVVTVTAAKGGQSQAIELHTNEGYAIEGVYLTYRIRLIDLAPAAKADQKIDARDYVATLTVSRTP